MPKGAHVFVDGHEAGRTPLQLDHIAVGKHQLRLTAHGYEGIDTDKAVRPGYDESFFAVLARRGSGHHATVAKSGRDRGGTKRPEPDKMLEPDYSQGGASGHNHGHHDHHATANGGTDHKTPADTSGTPPGHKKPSGPDNAKPNPYLDP